MRLLFHFTWEPWLWSWNFGCITHNKNILVDTGKYIYLQLKENYYHMSVSRDAAFYQEKYTKFYCNKQKISTKTISYYWSKNNFRARFACLWPQKCKECILSIQCMCTYPCPGYLGSPPTQTVRNVYLVHFLQLWSQAQQTGSACTTKWACAWLCMCSHGEDIPFWHHWKNDWYRSVHNIIISNTNQVEAEPKLHSVALHPRGWQWIRSAVHCRRRARYKFYCIMMMTLNHSASRSLKTL